LCDFQQRRRYIALCEHAKSVAFALPEKTEGGIAEMQRLLQHCVEDGHEVAG